MMIILVPTISFFIGYNTLNWTQHVCTAEGTD